MKTKSSEILDILAEYLEKEKTLRFTQALFNLNISEFADDKNPENKGFLHRDNYNDSDDKVLQKIKKSECYGISKK